MQNFNDQCARKYASPFKKLLRKILQRIAYVVTEQEYQDTMIAMELNSADAKEWVLRNDVTMLVSQDKGSPLQLHKRYVLLHSATYILTVRRWHVL
ncbi:hypothetical protein Taro_051293 [Colocasia esculenta]|uniref:Uncharacterized protein n=1 Tax=Colocasia esculenta TaxID=4460 RepID=A0A843XGI9_COLES|nr:hypothetical protein [Colocasia esculenta]